MLKRIGISLEDVLLDQFDDEIERRQWANRSEAVRDLIRDLLVKREWEDGDQETMAVVVLVYDHHTHDLGHKLTHIQHEDHQQVISTMHIHMDEENCLEILILKGKAADIRRTGDRLVGTKGVKLGRFIPTTQGRSLV